MREGGRWSTGWLKEEYISNDCIKCKWVSFGGRLSTGWLKEEENLIFKVWGESWERDVTWDKQRGV